MKKRWKEFLKSEKGMGVIESILVLVVLVGLVMIFKTASNSLVNSILGSLKDAISSI